MSEVVRNSRNHKRTRDRWSDPKYREYVVVYFLAIDWNTGRTPRVRIGYSTDFATRIKSHTDEKHGQAADVDVLCVVRGSRSDEKAIHRHFAQFKYEGGNEQELFDASPEVLAYVRWLRNQYFAWVPDDDAAILDELSVMTFDQWCPSAGREIVPCDDGMLFGTHPLWMPERDTTGDDYYTNPLIIERARETMGCIDLDPASHASANKVVKAARFFSLHDNGLEKEWGGNVWCNPPFSQWSDWAEKVHSEWQSGRVREMCILAATRTITAKYFAKVRDGATAMCVINGRIPFYGPKATSSPDDGHAIFYFGSNAMKFSANFSEIGTVYLSARAGDAAA